MNKNNWKAMLGALALVGGIVVSPLRTQACGNNGGNYMIDADGNCVDLSDWGSSGSSRSSSGTSSSRQSSQTHTFPSWLIDNNSSNEDQYKTGHSHTNEYSRWSFQNRYILTFTEWPYTSSSDNHAEWSYVDCNTGWKYYKSHGFVENSEFSTSPNDQSLAEYFPDRLNTLRSICSRMSVPTRF